MLLYNWNVSIHCYVYKKSCKSRFQARVHSHTINIHPQRFSHTFSDHSNHKNVHTNPSVEIYHPSERCEAQE